MNIQLNGICKLKCAPSIKKVFFIINPCNAMSLQKVYIKKYHDTIYFVLWFDAL